MFVEDVAMSLVDVDTIAAIATALGEASVGVVRVSGPDARAVAERVFHRPSGQGTRVGTQRRVQYGMVVHPETGVRIDEAMLLWMPGPRSYTAEDVAEFQVHGGIRVVQAVLEAVLDAGARLAEPGEFTKRAFLNGRLDLSQAEAVIDLIRAKTDLAAQSALHQVRGGLGDKIRRLRKELLGLQAHVEVTIDYPEHDVEAVACRQVVGTGTALANEVEALLRSARVGQILREGVATAIVGRPNVGKSSLLNALLRRERAIVTDIPGTTRDVLEEYANVGGIPFRLLDTAGIRETSDLVEQLGVARSRAVLREAQLALVVVDGHESLSLLDVDVLRETRGMTRLVVLNKADLGVVPEVEDVLALENSPIVRLSAKNLDGMDTLESEMVRTVVGGDVSAAEAADMTNVRQARWLSEALADLQVAIGAAEAGETLDVIAVQLQAAYASLGLVIGEAVGEDLLDEIFSRFCLGK